MLQVFAEHCISADEDSPSDVGLSVTSCNSLEASFPSFTKNI